MKDFIWFHICLLSLLLLYIWQERSEDNRMYLKYVGEYSALQSHLSTLSIQEAARMSQRLYLNLNREPIFWMTEDWIQLRRDVLTLQDDCQQQFWSGIHNE